MNSDYEVEIRGVRIVRWNPERTDHRGVRTRVSNFGDLLGPKIVEWMTQGATTVPRESPRLIALGSVMHFARERDVVWGAGVNGKVPLSDVQPRHLDIRAVRGPRTRDALRGVGHEVPEVFGDPAMLLPLAMPELLNEPATDTVMVVPNLHDGLARQYQDVEQHRVMSPQDDVDSIIRQLATARLVIGSSLHAVIVAEAFGVQGRFVVSATESPFKYEDYLLSTGRAPSEIASSVEEARLRGGMPPPALDIDLLRRAFPHDLWSSAA